MPLFASSRRRLRISFIIAISLIFSLVTVAQLNLTYHLLNGYFLSSDAPVNKGKPTLFVFEQAETFGNVFKPATTMSKRPDAVNFTKEMAIGIALPPTNKPPKLSVSKVFVQDSVLTVRYIRIADTTLTNNPQSFTSQPILLFAIPKQVVLKTKLVENGKVVQLLKKREEE
ncbi:hypothetical protein EXU85_29510 [Spirosoma sp. KCTC 42546]|uniref:hypothetical protein n=1 Tax=Spirosoma sp. KCTC 42546 TaxID=2520506 RepID=UPI00115AA980|nr:hypothetical protein [Spirosoma sp. KCTC 42546]QDK82523.1 hypothetical protein EXU85_29510 [Spirosoma sp. KCTC 42546]